MSNYFFFRNKSWQGPFTLDELNSLYAKGTVTDDTLVKMDGGTPMMAFECLATPSGTSVQSSPAPPTPHQTATPAAQPFPRNPPSPDFRDGAPFLPCSILEVITTGFLYLGAFKIAVAIVLLGLGLFRGLKEDWLTMAFAAYSA
ncbi:MAG: DUF4339 domain-containing protein [Pirellulales bacterium]